MTSKSLSKLVAPGVEDVRDDVTGGLKHVVNELPEDLGKALSGRTVALATLAKHPEGREVGMRAATRGERPRHGVR